MIYHSTFLRKVIKDGLNAKLARTTNPDLDEPNVFVSERGLGRIAASENIETNGGNDDILNFSFETRRVISIQYRPSAKTH